MVPRRLLLSADSCRAAAIRLGAQTRASYRKYTAFAANYDALDPFNAASIVPALI